MAENQNQPIGSVPEMRYFDSFKILFQDKNWSNNLLIGAVFNLIPLVGPLVLIGWYCEIFHRLVKREPNFIPKLNFSDFGYYLQRGLTPFLVALVIIFPVSLLMTIVVMGIMGAAGVFAAHSYSVQHHAMFPLIIALASLGSIILIFIPLAVISNAALTRAYLTEDFGQALSFGKIISYAKQTAGAVLLAWLVFFPATLLLTFVGMLACYFGIFPAMVITNTAWVYMSWQIYNQYVAKGGEPIPLKDNVPPVPSEVAPVNPPAPPPPAPPKNPA